MVQNRFFISFVILFLLAACKIDRKKRVDRDKFSFQVTNDSFLFFKNVRMIFYDFQDLPDAKWYAYRYSDRSKDVDRPVLTPVMVVDWYRDESYVLIEPNEFLSDESQFTIREETSDGKLFEYSLRERGRENMLEFATKIYEGIMDENKIFVKSGAKFYPLFQNEEDRESFRVVMADYYRLTRVF